MPPHGERVLRGVIQEVLLEEHAILKGDLPEDTAGLPYCTNSVRAIEPVAELDYGSIHSNLELGPFSANFPCVGRASGTSLRC